MCFPAPQIDSRREQASTIGICGHIFTRSVDSRGEQTYICDLLGQAPTKCAEKPPIPPPPPSCRISYYVCIVYVMLLVCCWCKVNDVVTGGVGVCVCAAVALYVRCCWFSGDVDVVLR